MNDIVLMLGWVGLFAPMALGAIGSIVGCTIAGQAAIGALLETETGHGRYVGISAMPSSQVIYGIVVMLTLNREITLHVAPGLFSIGVLAGVALMISSIRQGLLVASAINAIKVKPELFGLSLAPAAIAEGFAVFAFIFALMLSGGLPTG